MKSRVVVDCTDMDSIGGGVEKACSAVQLVSILRFKNRLECSICPCIGSINLQWITHRLKKRMMYNNRIPRAYRPYDKLSVIRAHMNCYNKCVNSMQWSFVITMSMIMVKFRESLLNAHWISIDTLLSAMLLPLGKIHVYI